jgi:beta-glucosidase
MQPNTESIITKKQIAMCLNNNDAVASAKNNRVTPSLSSFPQKFWWGVATSSYQVEGHVDGCGKSWQSDWDVFTTNDIIIVRVNASFVAGGMKISLSNPGEAIHHSCIDVFREDVMRAKSLGINTYRFSIEWSRIQPAPPKHKDLAKWVDGDDFDQETVNAYCTMIDILIQNQIRPIITLNHITLPTWVLTPPTILFPDPATSDKPFMNSLQGWEDSRTVDAYVKFVEFVVGQFKDRVSCWLTLNEPVASMIGVGYLVGIWPPGFIGDVNRAKRAYFNLIRAHVSAYDIIKKIAGPSSMVGFAHAVVYPKIGVPVASSLPALVENAKNQFEYFYTYHFLNSVISGTVDTAISVDPSKQKNQDSSQFFGIEPANWSPKLDFIGVNYYRSVYVLIFQVLNCFHLVFQGEL